MSKQTNQKKASTKRRLSHKKMLSKANLTKLPLITAVISTLLFCIIQLAVNANLNPLGAKLESLNTEKDMLIELNREKQEEIARAKSVTVITELADEQHNINKNADTEIVFIKENDLIASTDSL